MVARYRLRIEGVVQGVGFRPFVFRLAQERGIRGWISNTPQGVEMEVEAEEEVLDRFLEDLPKLAPPVARIDRLSVVDRFPFLGYPGFSIRHSSLEAERSTLISPDLATCPDCLRELFSPSDRRYGYPFLNCTMCGPRYTIIQDVPYDRERTTMRHFVMCPQCRSEYDDPGNRRFHAQPNACWECGPQLRLVKESVSGREAIQAACRLLEQGRILAIKGLGGYHLAVDATDREAVRKLRRRKRREEKPLAVMVKDLEAVREFCAVDREEEDLLREPSCPIVLLRKLPGRAIAEEVAPGNRYLGVFLPYTPLHHLLFSGWEGDGGKPRALVMTSGNVSEEPIACRDEEAMERLGAIADDFLLHDRQIHMRADDSVARVIAGRKMILRRSRGFAPLPIPLLLESSLHILGCGAGLKNTICLFKGKNAFLSQHIGDLENYETYLYFCETVEHLQRILQIEPEVVAYDLHPGYLSTAYAMAMQGVEKIGVQHHHAHLCSTMAENHLSGPCLGILCDGTGYGIDGHIWGCEFLVGDYLDFRRLGHLRYQPLPGGEASIKKPYRMALSYLYSYLGEEMRGHSFCRRFPPREVEVVIGMLRSGFNSPLASSLGRLFDAVSSLVGIRDEISFEGQAAMDLEMAIEEGWEGSYPYGVQREAGLYLIDPLPTIGSILCDLRNGVSAARIAASFHNTVCEFLVELAKNMAQDTGLRQVVLSGGVFQNAYLLERTVRKLAQAGLDPVLPQKVPPNDGGISLGQVAIASAKLSADQSNEAGEREERCVSPCRER
jgi:hydrogenase maturation protein HypF